MASDYSFLNIWAWAEEYGLQWAWDGKLVWIKQTRPAGGALGAGRAVGARRLGIASVFGAQPAAAAFIRVPETAGRRSGSPGFEQRVRRGAGAGPLGLSLRRERPRSTCRATGSTTRRTSSTSSSSPTTSPTSISARS
ncbi:MAG: hypothetical protein MZV70_40135 [Desulfobacterales bacterium]|nr:hypothetical protein [Desulfobacterales bacterium]